MPPTEVNVTGAMTDSESDDLDVVPAEDITVAIFCALPYESAAVKYTFDKELECRSKTIGPRKYVYSFGVIGEHNVVIARPSQMGTVKAAQCAATVSQQFPNVRFALLVGIGAGIPCFPPSGSKHDIRLGDIAVSIPRDGHPGVVEYDYGKYEADGNFVLKGSLDKPHPILISADSALQEDEIMNKNRLRKILKKIIEMPGYARPESDDILFDETFRHVQGDGCSECLKCEHKTVVAREVKPAQPVVHRGLILSGSGVVKNAEDRVRLRRGHTDAICFEMEAAGIVDEIPCLVVRGICDYADTHKQDGWHYYAAAVAAAYGKALLLKVYGEDIQEAKNMKETMSKISEDVAKINKAVTRVESTLVKDKDNEILDWLTLNPIDYGSQYSDLLKVRQPGTGRWLLDSAQYQTWLSMQKQTLFCPGIPGAGKTILTSIVIEDLFARFEAVPEVGIAYLYCNFQRQNEQQTDNLLASLLQQLAQVLPSLPSTVKSLYESHNNKRTRPSFDEISETLRSVATMYSRLFIVVDALDECQESDGGRTRLLSEISNLQAKCGVNVFATSRHIPDIIQQISEKFEGMKTLHISARDEDVGRYLDGIMSELPQFVRREPDLQKEIKTKIIKAMGGMFLLAKLHIDSLKEKIMPKAFRDALAELATGSDAYDRAYNDVMERIKRQFKGQRKLAMQVLSWIVNAKRPLTTSELQHALAVEVGELELADNNFPVIEDMVFVCAGLVTLDKQSNIIRLVHYTAQAYLERTQEFWFPNAQDGITEICVTYLSFKVFESSTCQTNIELEQRLKSNRLYDYAAHHWGHHARKAATCSPTVMGFLRNSPTVEASIQALMTTKTSWQSDWSQNFPRGVTGLHLAAFFGLQEAVAILLQGGGNIDQKDSWGRAPLSYAAENGHYAIVKLVLAMAKFHVNVDRTGRWGRTPGSYRAQMGHKVITKLRLITNKVDVDARDRLEQKTPLLHAAKNGHTAIVELLLATNKVDVDVRDKSERTPLSYAAANGHAVVVELLLMTSNVDIDTRDESERTPLLYAAANGHLAIVKLLLATNKVNIDAQDYLQRTPLLGAARNGHAVIVELLLVTNKVDIDARDKFGRTSLLYAVQNGHAAVVKLLLATNKVNVDAQNDSQRTRTPLSYAAWYGHVAIVDLLLATNKVDVDARDREERTPLLYAAENGHATIVEMLLAAAKVDVDARDWWTEQTPLSYAAKNGHTAIVKLMLATNKVDVDARDRLEQKTPLLHAAKNGHTAIVELLLATNKVDVDVRDKSERTPLSYAAANGHAVVVKLLLMTSKVDIDTRDESERTPLLYAAANGRVAIVELLLATNEVDVNTQDERGQSPLSLTAINGHAAIVELLLATNKVDVDARDKFGRTSLLYAVQNGHAAVVKQLLATNKVNVNAQDRWCQTPLSHAAKNGHATIVELLHA